MAIRKVLRRSGNKRFPNTASYIIFDELILNTCRHLHKISVIIIFIQFLEYVSLGSKLLSYCCTLNYYMKAFKLFIQDNLVKYNENKNIYGDERWQHGARQNMVPCTKLKTFPNKRNYTWQTKHSPKSIFTPVLAKNIKHSLNSCLKTTTKTL